MRVIDGSVGGGQILRSSLTLSMMTGEPVRIDGIRAGRSKPGLMRQHLTAVQAAGAVSSAEVEGAAIGATSITFRPGPIAPGQHEFHVSTAGSAGLVLQTILPALLTADAPSFLSLGGGTHNPWAPPWDFLAETFLPVLQRLGPELSTRIGRYGFYPAGGGRFSVQVKPTTSLRSLEMLDRGAVKSMQARVMFVGLRGAIAVRECKTFVAASGWDEDAVTIHELPKRTGVGNAVVAAIESDSVTTVVTEFGRRGVSAEAVAEKAAKAALDYIAAEVPVGPHLADQLLLPLALGAGGVFRTVFPVDEHVTTNAALIRSWLGVAIDIEQESETAARVTVEGGGIC